jgi:hypothetical protein
MDEACVLREGVSFAQFLGCNKIIIKSDNSQVTETMKDGGFLPTSSAAIFNNYRILVSGFREIIFEHCNQETNKVAHELARHSFSDHIDCLWDDDPPRFSFAKLINDEIVFENQ